jgi:hypothetical protein
MKEYDRIELDIDWQDRPVSLPQVIPKAPGVPGEAAAPDAALQPPAASEQLLDLDDDFELVEEDSPGIAEAEADATGTAPEPVRR